MKELVTWGSKAVSAAPKSNTQIAQNGPVSGALILRTDGTDPLPEIAEVALRRLLAAPAGAAQSNEDRMYEMMNYREACDGKPLSIVLYVLNQLRRYNPNDPFKPSAQLVFELCGEMEDTFHGRVLAYFFPTSLQFLQNQHEGHDPDEETEPKRILLSWGGSLKGTYEHTKNGIKFVKPKVGCDWGPAPLTEGCYVSRDLVIKWVSEVLRGAIVGSSALSFMPDYLRERIPAECWPEGLQEKIVAFQRRVAEERAERKAIRDYEESLDEEELRARWAAKREYSDRYPCVRRDSRGRPYTDDGQPVPPQSEAELRTRTKEIMAERKVEAEAKAKAAEAQAKAEAEAARELRDLEASLTPEGRRHLRNILFARRMSRDARPSTDELRRMLADKIRATGRWRRRMRKINIQRYVRELDVSENKDARQLLVRAFPVRELLEIYAFKAAANITAAQYAAAGFGYCEESEFLPLWSAR